MKPKFSAVIVLLIIAAGVSFAYYTQNKGEDFKIEKISNTPIKTQTTPSPTEVNNAEPQGRTILVSIVAEGGLCVNEEVCRGESLIYSDGYYNIYDNQPSSNDPDKKDYITPYKIKQLAQEINTLDYEALYANKFTDTCPIAYDGQELTYTFNTNSGLKKFSSCEVVVDIKTKPFSTIIDIISSKTIK